MNQKGKKHKKGKIATKRIATGVERVVIIVGFLFFTAFFSYYSIANMVSFIEDNKLQPILEWRQVFDWYVTKVDERTGYIPAITVASASLMLSLIMLLQSHFNRIQDRVMGFPSNYLDEVIIGSHIGDNLDFARAFFDPIESENLIILNYKSGFTAYYKFYPYRLFVCLSKENVGKGKEWEEIELYNFQYSNIQDDDPDSYEVLIEGSKSRLLKEYCKKSDKNKSIKLKFVLDSKWTNNLIPLWMRNFGDMYIREEFGLSFVKMNDEKDMSEPVSYKVLCSEYKKAPLASWVLLLRCLRCKKEFLKRNNREFQNTMRLQERENNKHGQ